MNALLRVAAAIDRFTERTGKLVSWLTLIMTLLAAYNAVGRYAGRFIGLNLSSNAYLEMQWYLFSIVFLLGAGWALKHNAHVRVDVLFANFPPRVQAWINLLGTLLLLLPFCIFVLIVSWPAVRNSWSIHELSPDPHGLPRYPLKAVILVGFVLLMVQALAELIRAVAAVRRPVPGGAEGLAMAEEEDRWEGV